MDFNQIILVITIILSFIFLIVFTILLFNHLHSKLLLVAIEKDNEKFKLFSDINLRIVEDELDKLFDDYINKWMLVNIIGKNITYISTDNVDKMIRDLDREIILELSELYLFYIKLLVNINNQDDLLKFIDKKIKEKSLEVVTNFNKPK